MKKILCVFLAVIISTIAALPALSASAADYVEEPGLVEGTYVPNQVVVMFKSSAIDTSTVPKKGDLESVGASFGDMMEATSSESEALGAADEETNILKKSLGDDFVLEETLVFDDPEAQAKAGGAVGALANTFSDDLTVALVSSEKYDTATMIQKLKGNQKIAAAEPNQYIHLTDFSDYSLNDTYASYLYHLNSPAANNMGGESVNSRGVDPESALSMNTSSAWEKLTGDEKEIVIAVVDTGVLDTHEDLKDRMWTNPGNIGLKGEHGYNFYNNNENSAYDDVGHGTHCAGIIAAEANNAAGIAGAAENGDVKIMALRVLGASASSTVFSGLGAYDYILKAKQNGVNVVASNNSWGGESYSTIFDEAIERLGEAGVLTIVAAANDSADLERRSFFPANSESDYTVIVGAADINGKPANFSNFGKTTVDLYAPGMNILSSVSYESYLPQLCSSEQLDQTTDYYGVFGADTVVNNGTVTPSTGTKAGAGVKSFGSLQYVRQSCLDDPDTEIADDARLELEVVNGRHTFSDNPYRLKITLHNAQYGEEYFLYFPYEKDPLCTGDDNTRFSITYETGETDKGTHKSLISVGDVYENENGRMVVNNGGVNGSYISYDRIGIQRHYNNRSVLGQQAPPSKLLSAEEAQNKQIGFGISISCREDKNMLWNEGDVHDLTLYLDSVAISKPGTEFDKNKAYDIMSGTSMACPAATGAVALLALLDPKEDSRSGAEYALALREKLFSCVRTADRFADLCSTGGYIDFTLIDADVPVISDAVCNADSETITLYGENLAEDNTLTYRRLSDGGEAAPLPADMTLTYSGNGKTLVIQNAKPLFGTYSEFIVTTPSGISGKGKFFLVKGQRQFDKIGTKLDQSNVYAVPYLFTDADGKTLFGVDLNTGAVAKFDGYQYYNLDDTDMADALRAYLAENGMSMYDLLNNKNYAFYVINTGAPLIDGNILNGFIILIDKEAYSYELYRGQLDLSAQNPRWAFEKIEFFPNDINISGKLPLTAAMYKGTIYIFSDPDEEGKSLMYSLGDDGTWKAEPDMPCGRIYPDVRESNGKLYYMFGTFDDPSLSYDEAYGKDVYTFDGEKWEKAGSIPYIGRYLCDSFGDKIVYAPITTVKNGFVIIGASVDGGGNAFLYNTETDQIEPLYYSANDTIADCYSLYASCVATRDGIYYIRFFTQEYVFNGYELYLLPADSGVYESPFEDAVFGDANGDGKVNIRDVTAIQRHLADLEAIPEQLLVLADANGNGEIDITDATCIQMFLAEFDGIVLGKQPV